MALLQHSPALHRALFLNSSSSSTAFHQGPAFFPGHLHRSRVTLQVRAEDSPIPPQDCIVERSGRRHALALGAISTCISLTYANSASSEVKKGFQSVLDKKDGYSFLYPFGWQEVVIEGQDKVLKDVIEPLESISVNMVPTSKQDVRDFGSPQEVADTLIKKVLAPPSQKIKLVEAAEHDVDGRAYYTFEFIAQAPNFTRHALGAISIGNGKFYTLTTGANERRWEKMKDKLQTVIDSFKVFDVYEG
ncbi:psbP-like protein 1, chloroplastic isoform X1 [Elaeis guineensis]|uniref:PsbP-like protein 1, chloroplastic isoform X1 n=1 Tax=Elaeis guineensis var. tenera TaxID=51953 RepID=A0A6I9R6V3_ELAGV|nr:psbP-like protein 1, chloroplastic isoform X1 [Elaeis guineensis]